MKRSVKDKQQNTSQRGFAKAPYNFVPLNDKIVPSEFNGKEIPYFDRFYDKLEGKRLISGYIDIEIKNETPLYIGSDEKGVFFGTCINGVPVIPGSSIRGLIRTLVEIMGFSKMKFVDSDRRLFFRSFGERSLRSEYQRFISESKPCLIKYDNDKFLIATDGIEFSKVSDTSKEFTIVSKGKGEWIIYSGKMQNKKNNWLIKVKDLSKLVWKQLSEEDIFLYKSDKTRSDTINLIKEAMRRKGEPVPCFYVKIKFNDKEHFILGHTKNFRLPYRYTIGDHILASHKSDVLDIAEAIFGIESRFASRVYFEDSVGVNGYSFSGKTSPKILSSPKPTCFQHYLEQKDTANLKTWNDKDANIRGFKLYWHRITPDEPPEDNRVPDYSWNEGTIKKDTQHTIINPLKPGAIFKGRIRFVNLTEVELGALLCALDLGEGYRHKIGMGKPLGLGSIKIKPELFIIDRRERYRNLFNEDGWYTALREEKTDEFIVKFKKYVTDALGEKDYDTMERIKTLMAMLEWKEDKIRSKEWLEKTRYMFIGCEKDKYDCIGKEKNEYRSRPILPEPTKVK